MCNPKECYDQARMYQMVVLGEVNAIKTTYYPGGGIEAHLKIIENFANKTLDVCEKCRKERKGVIT